MEDACLTGLRRVQTGPLSPVLVVVPGNLVALHLRRRLAQDGPGHANIRFMTLVDFARDLCSGWLLREGLEEAPPALEELLLEQVVASVVPEDGYFAAARGQQVLKSALLSAMTDLKEACITPDEFQAWAHSPSIASQGTTKYRELGKIYSEYSKRFGNFGFADRNDILTKATDAIPTTTSTPLFVYGFYDFNPLQRKLLESLIKTRDVLVFFPWRKGTAFDYALASLTWLQRLGCDHVPLETRGKNDVDQIALSLFDPLERPTHQDVESSVAIISAPGEPREVREIAREIIGWIEKHGLKFSEIAILLRGREPYASLVAETFSRLGIPYYLQGGSPLWKSRAGQSLRILFKVLAENFSRAAVMEFITYAPVAFDPLLGREVAHANPALWDLFSIEAGIVGGVDEWHARLKRLQHHRQWEEKERERLGDNGRIAPSLACIESLLTFLSLFFEALKQVPSRGRWTYFAQSFSSLIRRLLLSSPGTERVAEELERLSKLDLLGVEVTLDRFARAAEVALTNARESGNGFGKGGVFIGDIMSARGLTFRAVVVPGMVEKFFPRSWRQDPILLDHERQYLSEGLNKELGQKNRQYDEERLLFTLTLMAAKERVLFTFPRLEPLTGRERVPSFFLLRVMEAATGQLASFAAFEAWKLLRRVPLSRLFPAEPHTPLDILEYDLFQAERLLTGEKDAPLAYLAPISPFFERALKAEQERWGERRFTAFDGVLGGRAARVALGRLYEGKDKSFSPTRLETYARCPYRFFIEAVLRLSPLDEPDPFVGLSPMDRGYLVHRILFLFLDRLKGEDRLPVKNQELIHLEPILNEVADKVFREFEEEKATGFRLLWQLKKNHILEDLKGWLKREWEENGAFVPSHFEIPFSCTLPLESKEELKLRGRIDRIDIAPETGLARVIDYKTGKPARLEDGEFKGGEALQLPIYLYAASCLFKDIDATEADYYYVTQAGNYRKMGFTRANWEEKFRELKDIVAGLVAGIRTGLFIPRPSSCGRCPYPWICTPVADVLYERKREDPRITSFERLKEIP